LLRNIHTHTHTLQVNQSNSPTRRAKIWKETKEMRQRTERTGTLGCTANAVNPSSPESTVSTTSPCDHTPTQSTMDRISHTNEHINVFTCVCVACAGMWCRVNQLFIDSDVVCVRGVCGYVCARVWELVTRRCHVLKNHLSTVRSIAVSRDGNRLVSAGRDKV